MIESRCGILCSECGYKEQMGCKGCVHIDKPFWGDSCPVKACCESKEHEHCGQCGEFPCALLKQFAYDEKQGDGGKRIEQCKCWAGTAIYPGGEEAAPYTGAKPHLVIDRVDDREQMARFIRATCDELPIPKPKKKK